jgi:hypothetical protein
MRGARMLCIDLPLFICQKAPIEVIREITRSWLDSGVIPVELLRGSDLVSQLT